MHPDLPQRLPLRLLPVVVDKRSVMLRLQWTWNLERGTWNRYPGLRGTWNPEPGTWNRHLFLFFFGYPDRGSHLRELVVRKPARVADLEGPRREREPGLQIDLVREPHVRERLSHRHRRVDAVHFHQPAG